MSDQSGSTGPAEPAGPPQSPPTGDNEGSGPDRSRRRNWLRIVLLVSVALNLLVVGAIGAHLLRPRIAPDGIWSDGRALVRQFPRERREMVFETFRERRGDLRARREAIGDARRAVGQALRHGDDDDITDAFDNLADAEAESMRELRRIMSNIGVRLGADERTAFARYLERRGRHGPRRGPPK